MKTIGIFEVEELTPGRWRVMNVQMELQYVTYGTEKEVKEQLLLQTAAWKRKLSSKALGWRNPVAQKTN